MAQRPIGSRVRRALVKVLPAILLLLLSPAAKPAIHPDKDILTERETEDLREHADDPQAKLRLYVRYIDQRMARMHRLAADTSVRDRTAAIHSGYEDFADLCDELQANMDSYDDQHEDVRNALKLIVDASARWLAVLKEPEVQEDYDLVREAAIDAGQSVGESAGQMTEEQSNYFAAHKKDDSHR